MGTRRQRLAKLISVQGQLKAFHDARRAAFMAEAAAAAGEAEALASRFDDASSLSSLFPEIYHNRIAAALAREEANTQNARAAAGEVALANARTNMVERAYREVVRQEERQSEDKARLEIIEGRTPPAK